MQKYTIYRLKLHVDTHIVIPNKIKPNKYINL